MTRVGRLLVSRVRRIQQRPDFTRKIANDPIPDLGIFAAEHVNVIEDFLPK